MNVYTEYRLKSLFTRPNKLIACSIILSLGVVLFIIDASSVQSTLYANELSLQREFEYAYHNQNVSSDVSHQRDKAKLLQELKMKNINRALKKHPLNPELQSFTPIDADIKAWRKAFHQASTTEPAISQ